MPKTIHGRPVDEEKWDKAKKLAAEEGRYGDWEYTMGIYKRLVGMKNIESKSYSFLTDSIGFEEVEYKDGKKHYVTGYISTKDIDLYNDLVTERGMADMLHQLKSKKIKLDVEHEAWRDNPNILPIGKIVEAKMDKKGIWVKAELNSASPSFKSVWESIKNGFIDAFSIAYKATNAVKRIVNGIEVRLLNGLQLLNVALTGNPVNPSAKIMNVMTKSLNELPAECINEEELKMEEKAKYPWEQCIRDQMKRYGSMERAKKICGAIRAGTVQHKDGNIVLGGIDDFNTIHGLLNEGSIESKSKEEMKMVDEKIEVKDDAQEVVEEQPEEKVEESSETEESSESSEEAPAAEQVEEKAEEAEEEKEEEEKEEEKEEAVEEKSTDRIAALEKEITELKDALKAPQMKAKLETAPSNVEFEKKDKNPLDII